jgi:hypothetical protein
MPYKAGFSLSACRKWWNVACLWHFPWQTAPSCIFRSLYRWQYYCRALYALSIPALANNNPGMLIKDMFVWGQDNQGLKRLRYLGKSA